jgi:hypothetical protein
MVSDLHIVSGKPLPEFGLNGEYALDPDSGRIYNKSGQGWDNGRLLAGSGGGDSANVVFNAPGGRLTTESGVPVSTSDRTSQGTLYYTPARHNNINTWSGTAWQAKTFAELSLALSIVSGRNYDVFINADATALSLSAAWTNDTTRADALGTQDGVPVLGSDHTKLWLGTIRASGTNVTEDSAGGSVTQVGGKRFVWNAYNQATRKLEVIDTTASWSYTTATIRQANGAAGNKIEFVCGFDTSFLNAFVLSTVGLGNNGAVAIVALGIDTTTEFSGLSQSAFNASASVIFATLTSHYAGSPGLGYHYVSWNELGADGTSLFVGAGSNGMQSGLLAIIQN